MVQVGELDRHWFESRTLATIFKDETRAQAKPEPNPDPKPNPTPKSKPKPKPKPNANPNPSAGGPHKRSATVGAHSAGYPQPEP